MKHYWLAFVLLLSANFGVAQSSLNGSVELLGRGFLGSANLEYQFGEERQHLLSVGSSVARIGNDGLFEDGPIWFPITYSRLKKRTERRSWEWGIGLTLQHTTAPFPEDPVVRDSLWENRNTGIRTINFTPVWRVGAHGVIGQRWQRESGFFYGWRFTPVVSFRLMGNRPFGLPWLGGYVGYHLFKK